MAAKKNVLVQIDCDPQPSVFDAIIALDAGVDQLLQYGDVRLEQVETLVHGAIFTRSPDQLKSTALFFGGSDVETAEALVARAKQSFVGPMKVSLMSDPNGSNTTAAAAVICASRHVTFDQNMVTILGGTGPVGQRIAAVIASTSTASRIQIASRQLQRAESICERLSVSSASSTATFVPVATPDVETAGQVISGSAAVFSALAPGVVGLSAGWQNAGVKVAIDLNAVPPAGIAGIEMSDFGISRSDSVCYGAIGVGGLKTKIHRRCIATLFESNEHILETDSIYQIGKQIESA